MYKKVSRLSTVHLQRHSFTSVAPFLIRKQTNKQKKKAKTPPLPIMSSINHFLDLGQKEPLWRTPAAPPRRTLSCLFTRFPFSVSGPCGASNVCIHGGGCDHWRQVQIITAKVDRQREILSITPPPTHREVCQHAPLPPNYKPVPHQNKRTNFLLIYYYFRHYFKGIK